MLAQVSNWKAQRVFRKILEQSLTKLSLVTRIVLVSSRGPCYQRDLLIVCKLPVTCLFIVAYVCGDPLSRYTCRATHVAADFLRIQGFSSVAAVSRYTPPQKGPVAPVDLELPGVSHVKLPLKRCRATGGCSSYTCGCRATLCD